MIIAFFENRGKFPNVSVWVVGFLWLMEVTLELSALSFIGWLLVKGF